MTGRAGTFLSRWRLRYRALSVRDKLALYALLMLMPVLIFSAIYLKQSQRILESRAGGLITQSLSLSMSWMDELLSGAVRISAAVEADSAVRDFLLKHKETPLSNESLLTIRQLQNRLTDLLRSENRAPSVWLYFPHSNEVLSTQYGYYKVNDYDALHWLQEQNINEQLRVWVYPDVTNKRNAGSLMDLGGGNGAPYVSFTRVLPLASDADYPIMIGVGYIEYTLEDIIVEFSQKTKTALYMFNKNGQMVLKTEEALPSAIMPEGLIRAERPTKEQERSYTISDDGKWLIASSTSGLTGWTLVSAAPLDSYMGDLKLLNRLTIGFTLIAIFLAVMTIRSLTRSIHVPLRELLQAMKRMEAGDLSVRLEFNREDEFKRVANGFNRMVMTQDTLIRSVYQERIAKQQAEMSFLTSQINPHFLYNTLGALYSMAKRVDESLATSLLAISRMFRLSLNKGKELVTVKDSIDLITNYLHLLHIRNPHKYKLETYVEPSAEQERIPTLMLQPIVENAVKHGLELSPHTGTIRVSVTLLSTSLLIMISDNGVGLAPDELERVRKAMKEDEMPVRDLREAAAAQEDWTGSGAGSGYALHNIYRRLQLMYGNRFTFQIDSEWNKGTTVSIRIPREGMEEA